MIRAVWQNENIRPPGHLSSGEVWRWLNRADVAFTCALSLVPDVRLLVATMSSMALLSVRFLGGEAAEATRRVELAAYGIEVGQWRAALVGLNRGSIERDQQPKFHSGPGVEAYVANDWSEEAWRAARCVNHAVGLLVERAPDGAIRQQLANGQYHCWRALRMKFRDVDGQADWVAADMANQLLLEVLRRAVNPGCFSSVFLWARKADQ